MWDLGTHTKETVPGAGGSPGSRWIQFTLQPHPPAHLNAPKANWKSPALLTRLALAAGARSALCGVSQGCWRYTGPPKVHLSLTKMPFGWDDSGCALCGLGGGGDLSPIYPQVAPALERTMHWPPFLSCLNSPPRPRASWHHLPH